MSKEELNDERKRLLRLNKNHKETIAELETKIADLNEKRAERNALKKEVDELTITKTEIQAFIDENEDQQEVLTEELNGLTLKRNEIAGFIETNTPVKNTLEENISNLKEQKANLEGGITNLKTESKELHNTVEEQKKDKTRYEGMIKDLKDTYGLYSNDMKDMSKDSITQLKIYSWSSIASMIAVIALMTLLLCTLAFKDPFTEKLMAFFKDEPNLRFASILVFRISISAAFVFLIIVFINLSRAFVSQYIKARNRLTALRVADFLIGRLQNSNITFASEEEKVKVETERIKEQVALLNLHIPKIMDLGSSSFDKLSKVKDPLQAVKDLADIKEKLA